MFTITIQQRVWVVALLTGTAALSACSRTNAAASPDSGKIPITTKSEEARKEFLLGRDLSERLLGQESLAHFDKAISLDPEFATAELYRANNSPTTKDFFSHLQTAMAQSDKVSEGERLQIQAAHAGGNGEPAKQKDDLEKLVAEYPNDERAQYALGAYYFGTQDMDKSVEHLKRAMEIAPSYSATYNLIGYAYRQQEDYAKAEDAFKKYIELIPNDPNPYDSYAELLLKMGRFDESLGQYHKALSIDPHFVPSHFGISADLMYLNQPKEANAELQKMAVEARNDGELRTAYFAMAVVATDVGKYDDALKAMGQEYDVAEKKNDVVSMAADLQAEGNILMAKSDYAGAARVFERSFQVIQNSNQPQEIKDNSALQHEVSLAEIAIGKGNLEAAKSYTAEFRKSVETANNPFLAQQAHELAGRIGLAAKDYSSAASELEQANLQNASNLYRLALAYQGKGDTTKSHEYFTKAAVFNPLPNLNYAFIRTKAQKQMAAQGA